jgi:hypothetical protein
MTNKIFGTFRNNGKSPYRTKILSARNSQVGEMWDLRKFDGENNFTGRFCGHVLLNLEKMNTA